MYSAVNTHIMIWNTKLWNYTLILDYYHHIKPGANILWSSLRLYFSYQEQLIEGLELNIIVFINSLFTFRQIIAMAITIKWTFNLVQHPWLKLEIFCPPFNVLVLLKVNTHKLLFLWEQRIFHAWTLTFSACILFSNVV